MSRKNPPLSDKAQCILHARLILGVSLVLFGLPCVAQTANVWIDTNGGTCARSATPAAYNSISACASMQAAQDVAQGGDTVIMKNGTYPSQTLNSAQKTSAVSYVAETDGQAMVAGLEVDIDHVHTLGIIASGTGEGRGSLQVCSSASSGNCGAGNGAGSSFTDIVFDGFQAKSAFLRGSGITFQNGEVGGASACNNISTEDAFRFWGGMNVTPANDRLLNSKIHSWVAPPDGACGQGVHADCFQAQGGNNITVSGNTFWNCPSSNMQAAPFAGATMGTWLIENNYFGRTECCNSLSVGCPGCSAGGVKIRYNTLYKITTGSTETVPVTQDSNIYPDGTNSCGVIAFTGSHNVFGTAGGTTCGSSAKKCDVSWVTPPPAWGGAEPLPDLKSSDTCAKGAGNSSSYPATDIHGTARPQANSFDSGAFEIPATVGGGVNPPSSLVATVQ
jgi:hypothetical protein